MKTQPVNELAVLLTHKRSVIVMRKLTVKMKPYCFLFIFRTSNQDNLASITATAKVVIELLLSVSG